MSTKPSTRKKPAPAQADTTNGHRKRGENPLIYVGIGASAGGLEALRPFVAGLSPHGNITYIVAQHMSPDHRSLMVELLARESRLTVLEAANNLLPKADTIYVAPPNTDVTVVKGRLRLSKPTNTVGPKPSVDRFLMSLADDQEDLAIGIILSGTGSDGSRGIKAIKAAGGISIAQEPRSAKYDSMPNAAIRAGGADLVLPPHEIAEQLSAIIQRPRTAIVEDSDETPPSTMRGIIRQIATHTGMDFSNYKETTISRQILRRMAAIQISTLEAYGEYIGQHHEELHELAGNFLICVTSFFRDPECFDSLRQILRDLLVKKRPGDDIRIWIPGCATGEEVYSLAILLVEELGEARDKYKIQIFATDINNEAVAIARAGVYPEAALSGVDSALVNRYFTNQDGQYQIHKSLRDMTLFARQDLVQDPPFVRLDMISCRNLLIYFKSDLQEQVVKVFHYALRENGLLFLGKSESLGKQGSLFIESDRKNKLYLKRQVATPVVSGFSRIRSLHGGEGTAIGSDKPPVITTSVLAHNRLFELYAPASFLMNGSGDIFEIFGDCAPFLSIQKGRANFNAFSLIQPDFRAELRAFAHRVSHTKQSSLTSPVDLSVEGKPQAFRMAVHYVGQAGIENPDLLLICFISAESRHSDETGDAPGGHLTADRISELEHEIVLNRENLQTVIEELETANEELQSLNEEAQAANEELQASNEELETANEELQASNEELITVNDELNTRTQELSDTNADLGNVLESLTMAVLVFDATLRVTRHNRAALEFFEIPDETHPNLATLHTTCPIPDLLHHVSMALKTGRSKGGQRRQATEFQFQHPDGAHYQARICPYVDQSKKGSGGAVLTIEDISEQKLAEEKLRLSASVFEHASEATLITDANNRIISVNPAFTRITGYGAEEVVGKKPNLLNSGKQSKDFFKKMWDMLLTAGHWQGEILNRRKNGEIYTEWLSINVLKDAQGEIIRHIAVFSDITDAKQAQEIIERQAAYDSLTELPNRNLTLNRLREMLATSRRRSRSFAMLFMDLDHFKAVNDALGHVAGDEMLIKVAERIRGALRDSDLVGRMGGDEFVVLLGEAASTGDIVTVVNKLLSEIGQPLIIAGQQVQTGASIGITVYPMDGDTPEALMKNADSAMYEAKKSGRNTFCFFTQRMQDDANKRLWISSELSQAAINDDLELHYQPIVALHGDTFKIVGSEALLRWRHPVKGLLPPDTFIPIAEQNGMITRLSEWVLARGLEDWAVLDRGDQTLPSLAFNISPAQFVARDHIARLMEILRKTPESLRHGTVIEITESEKLSDNEAYLDILRQFRELGCRIAIDDFGQGYSSLSYLKRMPIDIIKIDRSFVRDITSDPTDAAMIRAILQMADAFGMQVVAEGVETEAQLEFLRAHGCSHAQGFLFCRPKPFAEISALLGSKSRPPFLTTPSAKTA